MQAHALRPHAQLGSRGAARMSRATALTTTARGAVARASPPSPRLTPHSAARTTTPLPSPMGVPAMQVCLTPCRPSPCTPTPRFTEGIRWANDENPSGWCMSVG
jgi:hypothetical protein